MRVYMSMLIVDLRLEMGCPIGFVIPCPVSSLFWMSQVSEVTGCPRQRAAGGSTHPISSTTQPESK